MRVGFSELCDDILYLLAKSLYEGDPGDAHALMLVCTRTRDITIPIVYSSVHLWGSRQCMQTLRYFQRNPWVASHVRQLAINPSFNTRKADREPSGVTEDWVSNTLEELAPGLGRLIDFRWDGSGLPKSRTFWKTLQAECPGLRYIGTSISPQDLLLWDDTTTFLDFKDLKGFSVMIKGLSDISPAPRRLLQLPWSFWSLIQPSHSPNLHHLSFESDTLRSFNFNPLFTLRLPSLNRLTIGSFILSGYTTRDLADFLHSARSLEYLDIPPVARIPWVDINFPHIRHYGGNILSILMGATHWSSLTSLDISCFPLSFERAAAFFRKISRLPFVTTLKVRVTSEDDSLAHTNSNFFGDNGDLVLGLLPALAYCCPNLHSLCMVNSAGNTLPWESILTSLKDFPRLNSLHLTQAPPVLGSDVSSLAKTTLMANTNLDSVAILRSLGPWYNTADCKIGEKVLLKYINRQPAEIVSKYTDYRNGRLEVFKARFSV